ncbi:methionine biosynthesis protein MetW [Ignavibacteriales bacterium]
MTKDINNPQHNDNRKYDYTGVENEVRKEYEVIQGFIDTPSTIIDLGCGNGSLLHSLMEKGLCTRAVGIDISESGVEISKTKGIDARLGKIDVLLPFKDDEFDYSICNVTMQMVEFPEVLLQEMKRISKKQIISFPNFAFYKNRIDLMVNGRMPKPCMFGYNWFSTGHIHQLSISDFSELVASVGGLKIEKFSTVFSNNSIKDTLTRMFPNLFSILPVFLLRKSR